MSGSVTALANGNNVDANGLNSNFNALNNPQIFFTTPNNIINSVSFTSGQVQTFTAWGTGGVPSNAVGILINTSYTSATVGANCTFSPHGGTTGHYVTNGNIQVTNQFCNMFAIVPLDAVAGQFDVKSVSGAGNVNAWMFGYVF